MTEQRWGLWNGHGWCSLWTPERGTDWGVFGSRAEAEQALPIFQKDYPHETYTIVPYEHDREPDGVDQDAAPTRAQWRLLDILRRCGTLNTWELPGNYERTLCVLRHRGWYMHTVDQVTGGDGDPPMRLTAAGERAWAKGRPD